MRHALRTYARLLSIQLRSQMIYRLSFWFELATSGVTIFMFFGSLALVFGRFDNLGGWALGEVAFLWGMIEFSFGAMDMIFSGFDPTLFGERIRRGTFDQFLLRPVNITVQVLGSKFVLRRLARMFQGAFIFGLALWMTEIEWTVAKLLYFPWVIVGLICFFGGLFIVGSTLCFWTIDSLEAMNIFTYGGSEMMAYPMHIYPTWLRRVYTYIIPGIFLNYYPALFFLEKPDPFSLPQVSYFLSPFVGIAIFLMSLLFWRYGIYRYQSTGT